MKRYEVAYQKEWASWFKAKEFDTYDKALNFYKQLVDNDYQEVAIIDQIELKLILRFDSFKNERYWTAWH